MSPNTRTFSSYIVAACIVVFAGFVNIFFFSHANLTEVRPEKVLESQLEIICIDNVVKVFMHNPGVFSVLYENPKTKELQTTGDISDYAKNLYGTECWRLNNSGRLIVKVFNDTLPDKMYLIIKKFNPYWCEVELHMSVKSLSGADYNYQVGEDTRTGTTCAVD